MTGREVVERYDQLAATVARMVELARGRRWALLPLLDAECHELASQLRSAPVDALSAAQTGHVEAVTRRIRCDQLMLNELVRPQFVRLVHSVRESCSA